MKKIICLFTVFFYSLAWGNLTLQYSYDENGRDTGFSLSGHYFEGIPLESYSVTYGYDEFGRINSVTWNIDGFSETTKYTYLPNSDLISHVKTGDLLITYTYEPNRNLRTQVQNKYKDNIISQYDYQYDELGRRKYEIQQGSVFTKSAVCIYSFNDKNELESCKQYFGRTDIAAINDQTPADKEFSYQYILELKGTKQSLEHILLQILHMKKMY